MILVPKHEVSATGAIRRACSLRRQKMQSEDWFPLLVSECQLMRYLRSDARFCQSGPSVMRLKTQYRDSFPSDSMSPSVARSYVIETVSGVFQLRNGQFGQSLVVQQIPLDVISEQTYDPVVLVSTKFQGRNITL